MFLIGQMSALVKNFNIQIFSDTINVIKVKVCMMVLHIELYLFITLSVTLTYFKVTAMSNNFNLKFYFHIQLSWNSVGLWSTSSRLWICHYSLLSHIFKGDNCHVSWFDKNFIVGAFTDTVRARFFKLCVIITLFGVYQFIQVWWPWPCFKVTSVSES